jgi:hypothetical protein
MRTPRQRLIGCVRFTLALGAATLTGLAACSGGDKSAAGPAPIAAVSVSPSRPDMEVGETLRLRATAEDAAGNVLPVRDVRWSTDAPQVAMVSMSGEVTAVSAGSATITASVEGKRGSARVSVESRAAKITIASIAPDPMVEGQSVVITGQGFDAVASNNRVTIDGAVLAVTEASPTRLTVTIPASDCRPARTAQVQVATPADPQGRTVSRSIRPAAYVNVPLGRQALVRNPSTFCLQFPASGADEAYLVGVQSTADLSKVLTGVKVDAVSATAGGVGGQMLAPEYVPVRSGIAAPFQVRDADISRRHYMAEAQLRRQERDILARMRDNRTMMRPAPDASAALAFPATLKPGDVIDVKVPGWNSPCATFTPIKAVVRQVGARHVWLEDIANPAGGYGPAEVQALGQLFDSQIYQGDVDYFGAPTDIDRNGKIAIVITKEVNRISLGEDTFLLGFVVAADLVAQTLCASSNEGEVFYGRTPDAGGKLGYPFGVTQLMEQAPRNIAHEFVHIIQFGHRLYVDGDIVFPEVWEAEGQATLAEEFIGHRLSGRSSGRNYGGDVAFPADGGPRWYSPSFNMLGMYYGWEPGKPRIPNAPEQCSWLQRSSDGNTGPCHAVDLLPYGVGWLFLRWLSDQFGPSFPNGEKGLQRALVDLRAKGMTGVSQLVGVPTDSLLAQFAAMQYMDDRVPGAAPSLTLSSWNLPGALSLTEDKQLAPRERPFGTFSDAVSVRGGSTAYFRISGSGHGATALRVRGADGAALPPHMRLWVVRLK